MKPVYDIQTLTSVVAGLSVSVKPDRTLELTKDLMTRQFSIKIFENLEKPEQYQLLNKRFNTGIYPHWFCQIEGRKELTIRHTETAGVRCPEYLDFEFPTDDYLKGLTSTQKATLKISGVS